MCRGWDSNPHERKAHRFLRPACLPFHHPGLCTNYTTRVLKLAKVIMLNVTELRPGNVYKQDGNLYQVIDYKHQKLARGTAKAVLKVKNLNTGATVRKAYQSGVKVEPDQLETVNAQFLYSNQDQIVFLDNVSYEQFEVERSMIEDRLPYLKNGMEVSLRKHEDAIVDITLPVKQKYKVIDAPPDARGDTSGGGMKDVTIETGLSVKVPMFIKKNDTIRIDTRNGKYVERAK